MEDLTDKLINNNLFKNLSKEEINNIIYEEKYFINLYKKGEVIATEDEHCTSLGIILSGKIEIQKIYLSGKHIVLKKLSNNQVFGEALIFSDKNTYPSTIMAMEDSSVLYIKRENIINLCLKNKKILENFIAILSNKVIMLNYKIKNISFKSVRHKVINFILDLSQKQKNSICLILGESKKDIAYNLGIPRPSLSRELITLREEGYIEFDKKTIKILKLEKLEEELFN